MATLNEQFDPHCWVKNYSDYLYGYAYSRLNDEDQAKDLVQETFLAALERADGFNRKCSEKTWLTAILKNKIVDVYRKKSSGLSNLPLVETDQTYESEQQAFFNIDDGHWTIPHVPKEFKADIDDPLAEKEFNMILQECLKKLPVLWFAVFTMKHIDEELTETICSCLSITSANFWVIIHRAKVNLRACLQKNWL